MAARSAWSGAINFAGFPLHVSAYNLIASKQADSFKTIAPDGHPVRQQYVDSSGSVVERDQCSKGAQIGKDKVVVLKPEAVEQIQNAEKSEVVEAHSFPLAESIPMHLATGHFRFVPNGKVPGSAQSVGILWNGLRKTKRALVVDGFVPRAGSRPVLLAIHADEYGLTGNVLPYTTGLNAVPEHKFVADAAQASMFEQFVAQNYTTDDFAHASHEDTYAKRRADVIAKAVAGEPIVTTAGEAKAEPVPDLMAAMEASLKAVSKKGGKKKSEAPTAIAA
jgi:DNA end-binding protein Ku